MIKIILNRVSINLFCMICISSTRHFEFYSSRCYPSMLRSNVSLHTFVFIRTLMYACLFSGVKRKKVLTAIKDYVIRIIAIKIYSQ